MLGRREEEAEREEVEKQLREVELQERMQQEADEQERLAQLGETGEPEGERDLDEEIPDADGLEEGDDLDDLNSEGFPIREGDDGMEDDLDNDIPDADEEDEDEDMSSDPDGIDANWVYDTRREPDTDEEGDSSPQHEIPGFGRQANATAADVRIPVPGSEYDDEHGAEDIANTMLNEDEIFDDQGADDEDRDLDDDVPEPESDQAWEHTDTELEESEMDISVLPGQSQPVRSSIGQHRRPSGQGDGGSRRVSTRRSSGPWISGPSSQAEGRAVQDPMRYSGPTPEVISSAARARVLSGNRHHQHQYQYLHTPAMLDSPLEGDAHLDSASDEDADPFASIAARRANTHNNNNGISNNTTRNAAAQLSGSRHETATGTGNGTANTTGSSSRTAAARNWLDGAAAAVSGSPRRTLFGRTARRGNGNPPVTTAAGTGISTAGMSSGGLFTPNTGAGGGPAPREGEDWETPVTQNVGQDAVQGGHGHARRRSGRFLGGRKRGE